MSLVAFCQTWDGISPLTVDLQSWAPIEARDLCGAFHLDDMTRASRGTSSFHGHKVSFQIWNKFMGCNPTPDKKKSF